MNRLSKARIGLTSVAGAALLVGSGAWAQSAPTAEVSEVIVTAQRRAERLQDVPLSIISQTGEQLAAQGVVNLRDLSVAVPGLRMQASGPNLQPAIRGVSSQQSDPGNDANVAIYVDGVYQGNQLVNAMELPDVERIEVAKGPQGTLFGRNATGGAIQVFTKSPSFTPTGQVKLSYGRFDDRVAQGFISGPVLGDKIAVSLSGAYRKWDGYTRDVLDGGRRNNGIDSKTARLKVLFVPTEGARLTFTAGYIDRIDGTATHFVAVDGNSVGRGVVSPDGASLIATPGAVVSTSARPYDVVQNYPTYVGVKDVNFSLKGEFDLGFADLTSVTAYDRLARANNDVETDQSSVDNVFYNVVERGRYFSQEVTLASHKSGPLSWVAGAFYYYADGRYDPIRIHGLAYDPIEIDVYTRQKTHAYAAFGEVNYDFTDRLSAIAGVRYSKEKRESIGLFAFGGGGFTPGRPDDLPSLDKASWDSFTPRFSLRYKLDEAGDNVYATYTTGFKSGGYNIAIAATSPFEPEKIKALEIGLKTSPSRKLSANLAAFYYKYSDLQVQAIVNNFNVTTNAARAKIKGFDADLTWRATPEFTITAGLAYLHARFTSYPNATTNDPILFTSGPLAGTPCLCGNLTGSRDVSGDALVRSPDWTLSLNAAYSKELAMGKFDASASVYWSDKYYLDVENRIHQPSYANVAAQVSFSPANTGFKFTAWGRNLTNEKSIQGAFILNQADGVSYGPPRTFGVSAEYAF
jgi:iron complex outermembrane receptor protein